MIKFDKSTCMVIASTDEIKYEARVSNIIAFGSPWPIPYQIYNVTSISFHNKKASSNFLTDRSKTVLLLWILFSYLCLSLP